MTKKEMLKHSTQQAVWVCYEERFSLKLMKRLWNDLEKSLTHRSRPPKEVTKLPLAAEGVTRRW